MLHCCLSTALSGYLRPRGSKWFDVKTLEIFCKSLMMMMMIMMNCFCGMVDRRKAFMPYFQPEPLSEILTIANLRHTANRVWTCAESEFRLCRMKLCSSDRARRHDIYWFVSSIYDLVCLTVHSYKLYNNKYMIASRQMTNTEISAFMAVLVFTLLSLKVLFINRKDNRNC